MRKTLALLITIIIAMAICHISFAMPVPDGFVGVEVMYNPPNTALADMAQGKPAKPPEIYQANLVSAGQEFNPTFLRIHDGRSVLSCLLDIGEENITVMELFELAPKAEYFQISLEITLQSNLSALTGEQIFGVLAAQHTRGISTHSFESTCLIPYYALKESLELEIYWSVRSQLHGMTREMLAGNTVMEKLQPAIDAQLAKLRLPYKAFSVKILSITQPASFLSPATTIQPAPSIEQKAASPTRATDPFPYVQVIIALLIVIIIIELVRIYTRKK